MKVSVVERVTFFDSVRGFATRPSKPKKLAVSYKETLFRFHLCVGECIIVALCWVPPLVQILLESGRLHVQPHKAQTLTPKVQTRNPKLCTLSPLRTLYKLLDPGSWARRRTPSPTQTPHINPQTPNPKPDSKGYSRCLCFRALGVPWLGGFRNKGLGFWGLALRVQDLRFRVQGSGFGIWRLGFRVQGCGLGRSAAKAHH